MISRALDSLAHLPPGLLLAVVFALPAAEASFLLGVVIPGETAVLIGGVVAQQGGLPLWAVIAAAIAGALIGDQIGFLVGRRWGESLLGRVPHRLLRPEAAARALDVVRRRGVLAVMLGRWAASLRALVPGIAGLSGMHHRPFTVANAVGGATWATVVAVAGYLAGASYQRVETQFGRVGEVITGVVVLAVVVFVVVRHLRRDRTGADAEDHSSAEVER